MADIQIETSKEQKKSTGRHPNSTRGNRKICIEAFDIEDVELDNVSDITSSTKEYKPANITQEPKKRSIYL